MSKARKWEFPGDPGGLTKDAPIGSTAWAQRLRVELGVAVEDLIESPMRVWRYFALLIEHEGWRLLNKRDGEVFESLEEFINEEPPWGLGSSIAEIQPYLEAALGKQKTQLVLVPTVNYQGVRSDLTTSCRDDTKSSYSRSTQARLRAILRAPKVVQTLYEQGLINQGLAARLGPLRPTEEEKGRIAKIATAISRFDNRERIDETVRRMLDR